MKTATIPAVRVEPLLREQLESVLAEGESLSAFVETAIREGVHKRRTQAEFIARGMASLARYKAGEKSYTVDEVMGELKARLAAARAHHESPKVGTKTVTKG